MGIEYRLGFTAPNAEAVEGVLRRMRGAREATLPGLRFEFGGDASSLDWPEASVNAEPGGAYFCDHCGGGGRAVLGEVVAALASAFGAVTVEELYA